MNRLGVALVCLALGALATLAGCQGCREEHPYVPYTIASGEGAAAAVGVEAAAPEAGAAAVEAGVPFAGEAAVVAPPGLAHWEVDGVKLDAPEGDVFVSALVRDFDGDGAREAFAIVRPADVNDPGVLAYYRAPVAVGASAVAGAGGTDSGAPVTFAPPGLARDASCVPVGRLVVAGKRSVLAELGVRCPQHPSGGPARWVAVVAAGAAPRVLVAVTVSDPDGAPALSVDGDVSDRDGDGRDDVALRVTIEGGGPPLEPGPRVSATLAWLDRSAGLSRDTSTTEASFAALAKEASSKAGRGAEAPLVPGLVAQVRALWRAACADGGAPRVAAAGGTGPIPCGAARALEDAGLAEVKAYATMGDGLRAALALDRAERPPAASTAARAKEALGWITQVAPVLKAKAVRAIAAVPAAATGRAPSWGPLAFDAGGKLLVRTKAGVVRVDPELGDETAAADVGEWNGTVSSPDGSLRWIETYESVRRAAAACGVRAGERGRSARGGAAGGAADRGQVRGVAGGVGEGGAGGVGGGGAGGDRGGGACAGVAGSGAGVGAGDVP